MFCNSCGGECPSTANFYHQCGQQLNLSHVSNEAGSPLDKEKLLKDYLHRGYPYAVMVSLLEKCSNLRTTVTDKIYFLQEPKKLLRQLLSCKISYKIQLKNLKYLPPQSLACEVYGKQENDEVKDLPHTVTPHATKARKSLFSQSLLCEINDKMH